MTFFSTAKRLSATMTTAFCVLAAVGCGPSQIKTSISLGLSATTVPPGGTVVLTATVGATDSAGTPAPTGIVIFYDGSTSIGMGTLKNGSAGLTTTSFTTAGAHTLTAAYQGDSNFLLVVSLPVTLTVSSTAQVTKTTLSLMPSTITSGSSSTLTATVSPAAATGAVTFYDGTTQVGMAGLKAGVATLTSSFTTVGTHNITAMYGGDATYAASTSTSATLTVQ